eukprot:Skav224497  [mRNA]  locus=scaffold1478:93378:94271:- [translate_table: standard]
MTMGSLRMHADEAEAELYGEFEAPAEPLGSEDGKKEKVPGALAMVLDPGVKAEPVEKKKKAKETKTQCFLRKLQAEVDKLEDSEVKARISELVRKGVERKPPEYFKSPTGEVMRYTHRKRGSGNRTPSHRFARKVVAVKDEHHEPVDVDEEQDVEVVQVLKKPRKRKYPFSAPSSSSKGKGKGAPAPLSDMVKEEPELVAALAGEPEGGSAGSVGW